ncbi:MAG: DUF2017 family protein [Acidimicrobiia bacterium]|nr:DUF2017 family protein [Acidimicrobiia bacterium]
MSHFEAVENGVHVRFNSSEKTFLGDVLPLLAGVGQAGVDPAATRLNVPVYLDNPEANEEWWRLMGEDLTESRRKDRSVFERVVAAEGDVVLSSHDADAFLRVVNEARLALAARMGLDIEEDHERLPEDQRQVLDYLGWILEELTHELSLGL